MGATRLAAAVAVVVLLAAGCGGGVDKNSAAYSTGRFTGFDYAKAQLDGGSNPNDFRSDCENDVIVDWESKQPDPVAAIDPGNMHHKEFVAGCVDGIKAALK